MKVRARNPAQDPDQPLSLEDIWITAKTIQRAVVGETCEANLQNLESRGGIDGEVVRGRLGLLLALGGRVPGNSSHFQVKSDIFRQRNGLENGRQSLPKIEAVYIHGWSK